MELRNESYPPLDSSFLPRAPAQRWHSVSRRSDLRPLSQGRSNRIFLALGIGVVVLLLGVGAVWFVSQALASNGAEPAIQDTEVAPVTPVAPTTNAPTNAATAEVPAAPEFHVVQPGEVLTAIARKYNTTVEYLAELNNIEDVDSIRVGQRLRLVPEEQ